MGFWNQVKRKGKTTSGWMYGQNRKSKQDELNSVEKRMDRQQSISKG